MNVEVWGKLLGRHIERIVEELLAKQSECRWKVIGRVAGI